MKLVWTREEEIRQGRYRTQAAIRFKAGFAADGTPIALDMRNSAGSANPADVQNGLDPQTIAGPDQHGLQAAELPRRLDPQEHACAAWARGARPATRQNVFFIESFIDEMALAAGKDPVQLRRELLAHRPDFQQRASMCWSRRATGASRCLPAKGAASPSTRATSRIVGMIAEVAVANGEVKVERVVIACDCGVVVNPRGVENQLEGGMIYGLSAALFGEITIKNGRVEQGNFDTYPVVRLKDAPKTEVYISPTPGKKWGGVGEPGATMIQPAVTNAIFAATGKRLRSLPIKGQNLSGAA